MPLLMQTREKYLIPLLTVIRCTLNPNLILPIRVAWFLVAAMSTEEITLFKVIFSVTVSFFEVPTGVVADLISRRKSILISAALFSIHALAYVIHPGFAAFAIAQILLGLCASFLSGADTAYLHSWTTRNAKGEYPRLAARIGGIAKIASAVLALSASALYAWNPHSPFLMTTLLGGVAWIAAGLLPPDPQSNDPQPRDKRISWAVYLNKPLQALRVVLGIRQLLLISILNAVMMSCLIFNFELYQIKLTELGAPVLWFGPIYAGFMVLTGFGGTLASWILKRTSPLIACSGMTLVLAASFLLFGQASALWHIGFAMVLQQLIMGIWEIIIENTVFEACPVEDLKSTLASMNSLFLNIFKSVLVAGLALLSRSWNLSSIYGLLAGVAIVVALPPLLAQIRRSLFIKQPAE